MTKPRNNNRTKENNKSGKDISGKHPTSSSPAGNVSGQGLSSSSPLENTSPSTTSSNKKAWVINESDMDIENTFSPPSGPVDMTLVEQTFQADTSSLDASLHAPNNDGNKGKSAEKTPAVSFPERAASPEASTAAVQFQPTKFYASAAPNTVEGFWNHFVTNHDACDVVDRQLFLFSSYGSSARCQGFNELKRIIIHFRTKADMEKTTANPMDSLFGLHFHPYDPSAIKANENERTLVVTDIPLFITDAFLRDTFSRFGNITKCYTKLAKLYCTTYITFESMDVISKLDDTWGVLCRERRAYVALLAGLPRGTIAADLAEIAHEISAKSINVPFSMNSYNPKLYAYCHFTLQIAMEAAMDISCALKHIGLTWHSPDEVQFLCHRCGCSGCMGIDQESSYIPTINWTEISDALQSVVQEVAALTAQMANMNSRLKVVEYTLANPPSQISSSSSALYIPMLMCGWNDPSTSPNHNINSGKLIDVNSPPTASAPGFTSIPQFSPLPSSVVASNSPSDMEQRFSHLTNTVSNIMGSVQKGIEQQTQLLALRQRQSKN
ncbi:hypothetical protein C1646_777103 [Rhizophagus diaphanus]|nr:hypothetical protein C1646_777103 [Rhizophagus diaphanus] [Rhizophagus sp. MUCL 43196]